jgi:phosphohistidine swiveling domain-containing protein
VDELFGELFERKQQGWNAFSIRNLWWNRRVAKKLSTPSGVSMVESIERRLVSAEKEVEGQQSKFGRADDKAVDNISVSLSNVLELVSQFSTYIYPLGFEATTFAGLLLDSEPANTNVTDSVAPTNLRTRTAALYRDMVRVKNGDLAEDAFVMRWGHRGPSEYDLAQPTYGEDISLIVGGGSVKKHREGQESVEALSLAQRLIHSKENAKDLSLRFLHNVLKPALLQLEKNLGVSSGLIHFARVEELELLADDPNPEKVSEFRGRLEDRRLRWEKYQAIDLGEQVSLHVLERLEPDLLPSASTATSGFKGKMISAVRNFEGPLVNIDKYDQSKIDSLEPGFIMLTRNLTPDLVSLFGRAVGCISENGGMLSHAAIVGRELDFPILTGIAVESPELEENRVVQVLKDGTIRV